MTNGYSAQSTPQGAEPVVPIVDSLPNGRQAPTPKLSQVPDFVVPLARLERATY